MEFYKIVEFLFFSAIIVQKMGVKKMDYFKWLISKALAKFAFKVSMGNVNTCCWFYAHQSELPEELKSLNKFTDQER